MKPTILLTGKTGQLGFELARVLAPLGQVAAHGRGTCDLADGAALRRLVRELRPAVIVNPAAYTAVDKAETDARAAFAVNAEAPAILAEEAARCGAAVLHFSTDYVFDGSKPAPYVERDAPNPQNTYGASKLAGEQALLGSGADALVLRTSWVFGAHGGNFLKSILRLAAERDSLRVVADQVGAPTPAALLADLSAHLVRQLLREGREGFPFGLYHVAAAGETSWHEYARFIVAEALAGGRVLKAGPGQVAGIPTAEYPTPAKRPHNSRLDSSRFEQTFGLCLPPWQDGVRRILQQLP